MKKAYYIVSFIIATSLLTGCNNDASGLEDITSTETESGTSDNLTRAFPQDNGAEELQGNEAEMFWQILQGVDDDFPRRQAGYQITYAQYEEIKDFTDELLANRTTESQKYRGIWNWMGSNIKYNWDLDPACSNEPYAVFTNKKCVCQGYANLLSVMLHTQGIDVINVNGLLDYAGGHAWNYVRHGGRWWVSDRTNGFEFKAENVDEYKDRLVIYSADGNFLETQEYGFNYTDRLLNLNAVYESEDALMVPFSVTLNNGSRYRVTAFSPTEELPENVREIYIGSNIKYLRCNSTVGLSIYAPNVEAAYVDPTNEILYSHAGVVYSRNLEEPLYIPAAMKKLRLMPEEVIGKNYIFDHAGIEELIVANGTKKLEAWAVEKCPNLKVAYVPLDTELDPQAFVDVHPDFQVIRQEQTGIKDIVAD